jgi:hypothetical protein
MRSLLITPRFLPAILSAWIGLFSCAGAQASGVQDNNGSVILRMCKSGDKVKILSVMCRSYINGHIDAAQHYGKGKPPFCISHDDREQAPAALVTWIEAHPESLTQPAGEVLQKVLAERFPCKGRK